jgi:hypothetical protein
MTTITLEEARLIIKLWAESSALLLVGTSEQPGDVLVDCRSEFVSIERCDAWG